MYGLAVIEVMTLSGHLSNIDEMPRQKIIANKNKAILPLK